MEEIARSPLRAGVQVMGTMRTIELSGGRRIRKSATKYKVRGPMKPPKQSIEELRCQIAWAFSSGAKEVLVYIGKNGVWHFEHDANNCARTALEQIKRLPVIGGFVGLYTMTPALDLLRESVSETAHEMRGA